MSQILNEDEKDLKITPTVAKDPEVGADTEDTFINNLLAGADANAVDMSVLNSFLNVSQSREQIYSLIDQMSQDETLAAILETYAEDCVETNDQGKVVWCESSDPMVLKYVTYLLDSVNVDKYAYGWVHSLIKYGDLYLRLYRQSDYEAEDIFSEENSKHKELNEALDAFNNIDDDFDKLTEQDLDKLEGKSELKEDINVRINSKNDHFVHYVEAISNPAEMFDLTRLGKTAGFIQAPTRILTTYDQQNKFNSYLRYKIKSQDINIYSATDFVHASLADDSSRQPEEVNIFIDKNDYDNNTGARTYKVKRGKSQLYNSFKIWRELSLLENSVLLNRITKSSIVRMIQVEVGTMPKEKVQAYLAGIKKLIEQKSAIDTGNSMTEYTNPGPVENNVYIPVHEGKGAITTTQIGGDVDPKQLTDLSWFQDKLFGSQRVPKQFFGVTDDSAGFNGGTSLSIISSRYGKAVKRIQNEFVQCMTDMINMFLLDAGMKSYVNKFTLKMQAPITQEELDKRDNVANRIRVVGDIMNTLSDIQDPVSRLKILKTLLSTVLSEQEVLQVIQDEINKLDAEKEEKAEDKKEDESDLKFNDEDNLDIDFNEPSETEIPDSGMETIDIESETVPESTETVSEVESEDSYLPTPEELNFNAVDNQ